MMEYANETQHPTNHDHTDCSESQMIAYLQPMNAKPVGSWHKLVANGNKPRVGVVLFTVSKCEPAGQLALASVHEDAGALEMSTHESTPSEPSSA